MLGETSLRRRIHPDDLGTWGAALSRSPVRTPASPCAPSTAIRHKDGSWRALEAEAPRSSADSFDDGIVVTRATSPTARGADRDETQRGALPSPDRERQRHDPVCDTVGRRDHLHLSPLVDAHHGLRARVLMGRRRAELCTPTTCPSVMATTSARTLRRRGPPSSSSIAPPPGRLLARLRGVNRTRLAALRGRGDAADSPTSRAEGFEEAAARHDSGRPSRRARRPSAPTAPRATSSRA